MCTVHARRLQTQSKADVSVHFNGEQFIDLNRGRRVVNKLQPISNFKASENSGKVRGCGKSFCLACCLLKP